MMHGNPNIKFKKVSTACNIRCPSWWDCYKFTSLTFMRDTIWVPSASKIHHLTLTHFTRSENQIIASTQALHAWSNMTASRRCFTFIRHFLYQALYQLESTNDLARWTENPDYCLQFYVTDWPKCSFIADINLLLPVPVAARSKA